MSATRFTLAGAAELAQEIRKSKFLAQAAPLADESEFGAWLAAMSDPTATHNCWAWRIGQRYRFNDDGEPAGTAGKPILQAIDGQRLDGVAVVVTRWFGGIKLGAGGLVRAYGGCAAECLRLAPKLAIVETAAFEFELAFAEIAALRAKLAACGTAIEAETYAADGVKWRVRLPRAQVDALRRVLADATRGRVVPRELEDLASD
jgi:uncharacterized YigZ family protein